MVKKLILICLIGLLEIVGFASPAWGHPGLDAGLWLAETAPQTVPAEQPKPESSKDTVNPSKTSPAVDQQQEMQKTQAEQLPKGQSQTQPFSPYDMDALRRFDAGDHRSK